MAVPDFSVTWHTYALSLTHARALSLSDELAVRLAEATSSALPPSLPLHDDLFIYAKVLCGVGFGAPAPSKAPQVPEAPFMSSPLKWHSVHSFTAAAKRLESRGARLVLSLHSHTHTHKRMVWPMVWLWFLLPTRKTFWDTQLPNGPLFPDRSAVFQTDLDSKYFREVTLHFQSGFAQTLFAASFPSVGALLLIYFGFFWL